MKWPNRTWFLLSTICLIHMCTWTEVCWAADWKRVYLATFPRAGNHWMRHLIEDASHIATSSVYVDAAEANEAKHLDTPCPWGGYAPLHGYAGNCRQPKESECVMIKTHYPSFSAAPFDLQPSIKTIRIVRHPVDSFCSYHVYHYGEACPQRMSQEFLMQMINAWRLFQEYWDKQKNVITIRYEDLYRDPLSHLKQVIAAIGYEVSDKEIEQAIAKNLPKGSIYKHVATFHPDDLALVESKLGDLMEKYHYSMKSSLNSTSS